MTGVTAAERFAERGDTVTDSRHHGPASQAWPCPPAVRHRVERTAVERNARSTTHANEHQRRTVRPKNNSTVCRRPTGDRGSNPTRPTRRHNRSPREPHHHPRSPDDARTHPHVGMPNLRPHHPERQQRLAQVQTLRPRRSTPHAGAARHPRTTLDATHPAMAGAASRDHQRSWVRHTRKLRGASRAPVNVRSRDGCPGETSRILIELKRGQPLILKESSRRDRMRGPPMREA